MNSEQETSQRVNESIIDMSLHSPQGTTSSEVIPSQVLSNNSMKTTDDAKITDEKKAMMDHGDSMLNIESNFSARDDQNSDEEIKLRWDDDEIDEEILKGDDVDECTIEQSKVTETIGEEDKNVNIVPSEGNLKNDIGKKIIKLDNINKIDVITPESDTRCKPHSIQSGPSSAANITESNEDTNVDKVGQMEEEMHLRWEDDEIEEENIKIDNINKAQDVLSNKETTDKQENDKIDSVGTDLIPDVNKTIDDDHISEIDIQTEIAKLSPDVNKHGESQLSDPVDSKVANVSDENQIYFHNNKAGDPIIEHKNVDQTERKMLLKGEDDHICEDNLKGDDLIDSTNKPLNNLATSVEEIKTNKSNSMDTENVENNLIGNVSEVKIKQMDVDESRSVISDMASVNTKELQNDLIVCQHENVHSLANIVEEQKESISNMVPDNNVKNTVEEMDVDETFDCKLHDFNELVSAREIFDDKLPTCDKVLPSDSKEKNVEKENKQADNNQIESEDDKLNILSNSGNESSDMIKIEHGLNEPDMMLEIPTQELIDCLDDSELGNNSYSDDHQKSQDVDMDKQTTEVDSKKETVSKADEETMAMQISVKETESNKIVENAPVMTDIKDTIIDTESAKYLDSSKQNAVTTNINKHSPNHSKPDNSMLKLSNQNTEKDNSSIIKIETTKEPDNIQAIETNLETCKSNKLDQAIAIEPHNNVQLKTEEKDKIDTEASVDSITDDKNKSVTAINEQLTVTEKSTDEIIQPSKTTDDANEHIKPPTLSGIVETDDENKEEKISQVADQQAKLSDDVNEPSTSVVEQLAPDTTDEVPEVTDSLGLLAESSRVVEDDEDAEDDEDGDDDEDFDQEDDSNQMTAEHSEDSNAQQSETDVKEQEDKEAVTPDEKDEFNFNIANETTEIECAENAADSTIDVGDTGVNVVAETTVEKSDQDKSPEPTNKTDLETVKLDISDAEMEETSDGESILKNLLIKNDKPKKADESATDKGKLSPSKKMKLEISQPSHVLNIVELEESSSEDDVQEVKKQSEPVSATEEQPSAESKMSINLPNDIEIMSTSVGDTSEIVSKEGEIVISGVPKPPPQKPARLNTSEVSIKTINTSSDHTLVIPEAKQSDDNTEKSKPKLSLEVFNLDSDDDETPKKKALTALEMDKARETSKCINYSCKSGPGVPYHQADAATMAYYDAGRKRRSMVCQNCADVVLNRTHSLVNGIKELTPLLELDMSKSSTDLVEISDSESEDEADSETEPKETIGEGGAKLIEEQLAEVINETWLKYKLDERLKDAQLELDKELLKLEEESKEIDTLLNECQIATDKLRNDLYGTFEPERRELNPLIIYDTPNNVYSHIENTPKEPVIESDTRPKRRLSGSSDTTPQPAKRPAIPLGYKPIENTNTQETKPGAVDTSKAYDDKDVSVVKLSAEVAPSDLPPPGDITRPPLRVGMAVYAMRNSMCSWMKAKITEILPKPNSQTQFTTCRVRIELRNKVLTKLLPARCLAYTEPADVRLTIGTRVIALFKETNKLREQKESYYSGIVAEIPNPVNRYRYLIFFDDGYAQYVRHCDTRIVCESATLVWEEVHPFSREFVRQYLLAYPERPMVRLHAGQSLKIEWNGKWLVARVQQVDASLVLVHFEDGNRTEWIYRGSTRLAPLFLELQAAERQRARPLPRSNQRRMNMPYVEYTRSEEQAKMESQAQQQIQQNEEMRRQRAVAKKSTTPVSQPPPPTQPNLDNVTSRVVYYTPKNAVKPYKMVPHVCSPKCKRSDVLALKDLRTYNPLAKPLLSGWERQIVRFKGHKEVMYRAPCGRRVRNMRELHRYLRMIRSDMAVDLFDFGPNTHCLAEFVLNKCIVGKKDLSHGKENVPVPCVNYYDESLPEFCSYNTERTPTAGVPLNLDPEFLCGCDCTDDCEDKAKCACWKMTLEGARTIGLEGHSVGYVYKRLPEPLPSGIYECNSRCKCKMTCLNRVAQHPLQLKLQVFKTLNRGWGIRALNDVPKGSFLCVYAGNLLTDATANLDGLNEGDEYLAELDYIEVVEQMKEGFEEDIPEVDKKLDREASKNGEDDDEEGLTSSEEEDNTNDDKQDDDFRPGFIGLGLTEFNKRLRIREKKKGKESKNAEKDKENEKEATDDDGCITISDDEEVREPSRFTAQAGIGGNEFISKYRSVRSHFGKDEACYIMDAKVQGNIGRYLNHSCTPNVFVQNVFVDTHDPRFPWVAFFALSHIKAGTELTWNYNYDVGSVPGKILYCYCGAPNCRGRLL